MRNWNADLSINLSFIYNEADTNSHLKTRLSGNGLGFKSKAEKKRIALVVPTLNGGSSFAGWLHSLKSQTIKPDRLVLIDSSSSDTTTDLAWRAGFEIFTIPREDFSHGGSRQLAAEILADYEFIIYMTQDAFLASPEALEILIDMFKDPRVGAVYGRQLPRPEAGHIESHARLFNYPRQSQVRGLDDISTYGLKTSFISNSFAAWRNTALKEIDGFPLHVIQNEDAYAASGLINAGWKIAYCAEASVYHSHGYNYLQEFRRYFDIGVFHASNNWIREMFGQAEGEGMRFVKSEIAYLIKKNFLLIPSSIFRTGLKLAGYRLGTMEKFLPKIIKSLLTTNKSYWENVGDYRLPEITQYKAKREKEDIDTKNGQVCVIFGGSGYVGTRLAKHFLETGRFTQVHIADIKPTSLEGERSISSSYTDVRNLIPVGLTSKRPEWIFNLAAVHREPGHRREEYFETNIAGARNICHYAESVGCNNIYFSSSVSVYGPTTEPTDERSLIAPSTPYGSSKYAAELIHECWFKEKQDRRLLISRPGVIYGPGDPGNILRMIKAVNRGYFAYPGSPDIRKSYAYIYGFIDSVDFVIDSDFEYFCYNYVEAPTRTLAELVDIIKSHFNTKAVALPVSKNILLPAANIIQLLLGDKNPIHPVRVRKAAMPTHIVPGALMVSGFRFKFGFADSLHHWQAVAPEDFKPFGSGWHERAKNRALIIKKPARVDTVSIFERLPQNDTASDKRELLVKN